MQKLAYALLGVPNAAFGVTRAWSTRPVVYDDVDRICPQLRLLEQSYPVIRQEYLSIRANLDRVPHYHEVDGLQRDLSESATRSQGWRVFFVDVMGRKPFRNRHLCPVTTATLDRIPGTFQAFFSILEGGKSIASHSSPYWGYLRYHLALEVPQSEPQPKMRVRDQWLTWTEGKGFLFDDTWDHELINENRALRSVLIVDIARPTGWVGTAVHRIVRSVLKHSYARWVVHRSGG